MTEAADFKRVIDACVEKHLRNFADRAERPTIFHFLLELQQYLFDHLCRACDVPNGSEDLKTSSGLRAVTYFSWEPREQIFQVRRTYPTAMDLMSYSVCYPEWGAVGAMLDALREGSGRGTTRFPVRVFSLDESSYFEQRALPYLLETQKLRFNRIIAIPVFSELGYQQWRSERIFFFEKELLGIFLAFVKCENGEEMEIGESLVESIQYFSERVGRVVNEQESRFTKFEEQGREWTLSDIWKSGKVRANFISLRVAPRSDDPPTSISIRSLSAFLVQSLRGRFYLVEVSETGDAGPVTLYAAPSKDLIDECGAHNNHLLRTFKSDLERGLRSIGMVSSELSYATIAKNFDLQVDWVLPTTD